MIYGNNYIVFCEIDKLIYNLRQKTNKSFNTQKTNEIQFKKLTSRPKNTLN